MSIAPSWYYSEEVMENSARLLCQLRGIDPEAKSETDGKMWKQLLMKEIVPHCDVELAMAISRSNYKNKGNKFHDDE